MTENVTQQIWGVDFSAAKGDAGRKTWIADCRIEDDKLAVCSLESASERFDLRTKKRDPTFEKLVTCIGTLGDAIVAMDFPFSLPCGFLGTDDWESFVKGTPGEWGVLESITGPKSLYEEVKKHGAENNCCLQRATDDNHGGQNPAGFRIKTQTYYGISAVLKPLIEHEDATVLPFQSNQNAPITVIETYPAAVFERLGAERRGYKSDDRAGVSTRRYNLTQLEKMGVKIDATDADCAIGTDNALDALAAAYGAWVSSDEMSSQDEESAVTEGKIYAGKKQGVGPHWFSLSERKELV